MKNKKRLIVIMCCMLFIFISNIYATGDFWGQAAGWFKEAKGSYFMPTQATSIINIFTDMINVVGTTVIVIATVVLGIKYMLSSVDSKTEAKEGLITLFIACVFFFGWTSISELLFPKNNFIFISNTDTSYENVLGRILSAFSYIANIIAILVVIYVGVKYLLAGASGKADLKGKSVNFIIGIILVFATTNALTFISKIITETFQ